MAEKLVMTHDNLVYYQDIKGKIQPFDLLAFKGGDIMSDLISVLEKYEFEVGTFTHVGMVVTSDILPKYKDFTLEKDKIYIFESTFTYNVKGFTDGPPDVITKSGWFGVQLRDLEEVIPSYITNEKTEVAWCSLINNPYNESTKKKLSKKFSKFFESYEGRFYEMDVESLLASMFPCLRSIRSVRDNIFVHLYQTFHLHGLMKDSEGPAGWQFCSELVANVYQMIGIIPKSVNTKNILPINFFGFDHEGIPSLVQNPIFIKDWNLPNQPAIHYPVEN